jgi:hypothetical protein
MPETMIPIAAARAAIDAMEAYVPYAQRENARAAALAVSIGYAYPENKRSTITISQRSRPDLVPE